MRHWKQAVAVLAALALNGCGTTTLLQAKPVNDAAIASSVKAAIGSNPELNTADIGVTSREGIVQLSGFVSSAESVATAASVARTVKGVKSVKNDLRLK
jgi:hyperosmotically inducible protein